MDLKHKFFSVFKEKPHHLYFSPGRVNLIGEHIDYNGGLVFPAAISLGTYAALKETDKNILKVYSKNFEDKGIIDIHLDDLSYNEKHHFANYIKGVLLSLKKQFDLSYTGFDLYIEGTLPPQSGLSSSASLLVLIVYIIDDLYHLNLSRTKMALIAQQVENQYMNMHCGIMDQLIIAEGIKDKALLMDTSTYKVDAVSAFFENYTWVIMNTNYQRKTTDSKYNERVKECQEALSIINKHHDIKHLCDIDMHHLDDILSYINDPILEKRVRHTVTEQHRVILSKKALSNQDPKFFGDLLNESHSSLKNDYEVTGIHLDTLVDGALKYGAIGARVTGAGFGGCAIALVKNEALENFEKQTQTYYKEITGLKPSFYVVEFVDGVHKLNPLEALLNQLISYGIDKKIINDKDVAKKNLETLFNTTDFDFHQTDYKNIYVVLEKLLDIAYSHQLFKPNTTIERDQFEALIFDQMMPDPKSVKETFKHLFSYDKDAAIKYLYNLSIDVNYIKMDRIKNNLSWIYQSSFGPLEMTINLSKPEKDPRDIEKLKEIKQEKKSNKPLCVLCKENEHRYENARMNLRIIPMILNKELWHFQYSPYAYFNEHAIVLSDIHRPMKINHDTFLALFDFVDLLPSYLIGSNADLPIVGGSILNHDHFQAGRYTFPIENAQTIKSYTHVNHLSIDHLNWPLSTMKCESKHRELLIYYATHVLKLWKAYDNHNLEIYSKTDQPHQTITPILRKKNDIYQLYLILRNNRKNEQYPYGIFHPHEDVHHIKKENIGLIEAIGLAILPGRLKNELQDGFNYIQNGIYKDYLSKHKSWLDDLKDHQKIHSIHDLYQEVGKKFETVLSHAGVFKLDKSGINAFDAFIQYSLDTFKN